MHRTFRHLGVAALFASGVAFAQSEGQPAAPPSVPNAPSAVQPATISKLSSSVKKAYSNIDQAKGVLSGSSPTKNHGAMSLLSKAEHELGQAKSAMPSRQQQGTDLLQTAQDKVASAKSLLHGGHLNEAKKALQEVPPLKSVEQSLSGATGVGGSGSSGISLPGTSLGR
jgi:hypothetical protein